MKVEHLQTKNQLNFENFKNFAIKKKITFSFFHFFIFFPFFHFSFLVPCIWCENLKRREGVETERVPRRSSAKACQEGKICFPLRGTPPPQVPRSIRTEQEKKE